MAAGLVEDDAAEAVVDGHRHHPRRAVARPGHGDGLAGGVDANLPGVDLLKHLQPHPAAGPAAAGLGLSVDLRHGGDGQPGADLPVLGIDPLAVGHQDPVVHVQQGAGDLADGSVIVPGGKIALLQDLHLPGIAHGGGDDLHRMDIPEQPLVEADADLRRPLPQGLGGLGGAAEQPLPGWCPQWRR